MPIEGGEEVQVIPRGFFTDWGVSGEGITCTDFEANPMPTIEFLDFATGATRRLAALADLFSHSLSVSPDGRWILCARNETEPDIMLVENFR